MSAITQDRMEDALAHLSETDGPCAELRSNMERAEYKAKAIRDAIFLREEGTVAERSAKAGASTDYEKAMNLYFDYLRLYEAMRNKRQTEGIVIDTWRSLNANRRQG
jgi:hypothetical protein